ncbi:antitoxin VbhA family protein [Sutcliffiella horikoshii]|uniref:antitoxin VbhA family protein n=1 Tax=Sutcliffiella horikoshii TaxID=79883 RepID=UPI001CFC7CE7|nr:antitoxin VbhA family protein [Sutcliffiella horikoshii]
MPRKQLEKALKSAKASMEASGFHINEQHTDLVRRNLSGELTDEEFNKEVMKLVKAKGGQNDGGST